jgi:non-homologous end joining protein Ku
MRTKPAPAGATRKTARKHPNVPPRQREKAPAAGVRPFWKGHLQFGLVQIPVELHSAEARDEIDFDLLRALEESGKVGIAGVVLRVRESIAALLPHGGRLVLNMLRWEHELRPAPPGPPASARPRAGARERTKARRLIDEMSAEFRPASFPNHYRKELLALVRRRARSGSPPETLSLRRRPARVAKVVDLAALLEKSVPASQGTGRKPARRKRSA